MYHYPCPSFFKHFLMHRHFNIVSGTFVYFRLSNVSVAPENMFAAPKPDC